MTDIKLSLIIILPGGVMFSREESLKRLKKPVKNKKGKVLKKKGQIIYKEVLVPDFAKNDVSTLTVVTHPGNNPRKVEEEKLTIFTRKSKPAKQVINLTEEAYEHMISKDAPYGYRGKTVWSSLSRNQRIKWHCERIAESIGGTFESFQVLND